MLVSYFKITNLREVHNGYVYTDGLNILDKPFEEVGSCVPGGLYFTTIDHIHKFYHYGCNLREISLPKNLPDFKMVPDGNKFRANKIILGKSYSLLDDTTYIKFNLRPMTTEQIMQSILNNYDDIHTFNLYKKHGYMNKLPSIYIQIIIEHISANGFVDGLSWFRKNGFVINSGSWVLERVAESASENSRLDVLDWWISRGYKLLCTHRILETAIKYLNLPVLNWWKKYGCANVVTDFKKNQYELAIVPDISKKMTSDIIQIFNWWESMGL